MTRFAMELVLRFVEDVSVMTIGQVLTVIVIGKKQVKLTWDVYGKYTNTTVTKIMKMCIK